LYKKCISCEVYFYEHMIPCEEIISSKKIMYSEKIIFTERIICLETTIVSEKIIDLKTIVFSEKIVRLGLGVKYIDLRDRNIAASSLGIQSTRT